ncbi:hypothetical protein OG948_54555 (plasmid) [Embleya sp. NBC_00888]|uniref:hypothetical protein n=1 Tax=Embleya sp. NBC_00888 TaxID=2975960 RepID=UPI003867F1BD|nr:hypothetical protein OG948_54555 [Embleya sp. NBC_00888]
MPTVAPSVGPRAPGVRAAVRRGVEAIRNAPERAAQRWGARSVEAEREQAREREHDQASRLARKLDDMRDVPSRDELMARRERLEQAESKGNFLQSLAEDMRPVPHNEADTWAAFDKAKQEAAAKIIRAAPAPQRSRTAKAAPTRHPGIIGGKMTVAKSPASLSFTAFGPAAGADYMVPTAGTPVHNLGTQNARRSAASRDQGM